MRQTNSHDDNNNNADNDDEYDPIITQQIEKIKQK